MKIQDRKNLAILLGERTGADIHYSEVYADAKYVYRHNAEYPDEVELYQLPLPWGCAEVYDDIAYDRSPFVNPNNFK
tara:strand:+ start:203 stop:433 length:231 start_codon:yes stop_codon:yes gene_type:complete